MITSGIIKPIGPRDEENEVITIAKGVMDYDPSDYEKMGLFASTPLVGAYERQSGNMINICSSSETIFIFHKIYSAAAADVSRSISLTAASRVLDSLS